MHIGIDLGTSGIKAVLIEDLSRVVAVAAEPVAVSRPHLGWSEQDPDLWVQTVLRCLDRLALRLGRIRVFSGQDPRGPLGDPRDWS